MRDHYYDVISGDRRHCKKELGIIFSKSKLKFNLELKRVILKNLVPDSRVWFSYVSKDDCLVEVFLYCWNE